MADPPKHRTSQLLEVLQVLKQASHDLQANPSLISDDPNSAAIKALLELHTESDTIFSDDPNLSSLSRHLTDLKNLVDSLRNTKRGSHLSLRSFVSHKVSNHSASKIAGAIESEIQKWIDRVTIGELSVALREPIRDDEEEELVKEHNGNLVNKCTRKGRFEKQNTLKGAFGYFTQRKPSLMLCLSPWSNFRIGFLSSPQFHQFGPCLLFPFPTFPLSFPKCKEHTMDQRKRGDLMILSK